MVTLFTLPGYLQANTLAHHLGFQSLRYTFREEFYGNSGGSGKAATVQPAPIKMNPVEPIKINSIEPIKMNPVGTEALFFNKNGMKSKSLSRSLIPEVDEEAFSQKVRIIKESTI